MKQTARKLIYQDDSLLTDICNDLRKFKPALEKLKAAYAALELTEDFNDSIHKELITKGSARMTEQYKKELNAQLDKSGITNTSLRAVALSGAEEPQMLLSKALQELKEVVLIPSYVTNPRHQVLSLRQISYVDQDFVITDQDRESIAETHCRIYLETEEDHKTYNILLNLQDALAAFEVMKMEKGLPNNIYGAYGQHIHNFFGQDGELQPGSINWVNGYKAQMESMHNASVKRQQKDIAHSKA